MFVNRFRLLFSLVTLAGLLYQPIAVHAVEQQAFRIALHPPVSLGTNTFSIVDASYPSAWLPFNIARVMGDPGNANRAFGQEDLSFNMDVRTDSFGNVICRGALIDPDVRTYRRTLTRGFVPAPGLLTTLRYESDSTYTEIENGSGTEYRYDTFGRLQSISEIHGQNISIARDPDGKIVQLSDNVGRAITFSYTNGLITTATFSAGGSVTYQYTNKEYGPVLSEVRNLVGAITSGVYNDTGDLVRATNPRSGDRSFTYLSSPLSVIVLDSNGFEIGRSSIDTANPRYSVERNSLGLVVARMRDFRGLVTLETTSSGKCIRTEYDAEHNPIRIVSGTETTLRSYAAHGLLLFEKRTLYDSFSYSYDTINRLVSALYPYGRFESFAYDASGFLTSKRAPNGGVYSYSYDSHGDLTRIIDPDGVGTSFTYNAFGLVTSISTCVQCGIPSYALFLYDSYGYCNVVGNGLDSVVMLRDAHGRLLSTSYIGGGQVTQTWGPSGLTGVFNNTTGETKSFGYSGGKATSIVNAVGGTTAFGYSQAGLLTSQTDAKGAVTTFSYDSVAALSAVIFPSNQIGTPTRRYNNDAYGRPVSYLRETGDSIEYTYDGAGRPFMRSVNGTLSATLSYDSNGWISGTTDPLGTITIARNSLGLAESISFPNGSTVVQSYSQAGRIKRAAVSGHEVVYNYDGNGIVSSVSTNAGDILFTYDTIGRLSVIDYPNGIIACIEYSAFGEPRKIEYRNVGSETITISYTRNAIGKLASIYRSDLVETMVMAYTSLGEIRRCDVYRASESITYTYAFDSVGNRVLKNTPSGATVYIYDTGNLLDTGGVDYTYNIAGEVVAIGERELTYNAEGRLKTDSSSAGLISYDYDVFGRRLRSMLGGAVTWRLWDERGNEVADVAGDGSISEFRYYFPKGLDALLGFTRGNQTWFTLRDASGNVIMVVDETGTIVARYSYDPFQIRWDVSFDSITNLFRFASRRQEGSSEVYLRARSLDIGAGRFMQRDMLFAGDRRDPYSWHGYAYANNDPVNKSDPSGLACQSDGTDPYTIYFEETIDQNGPYPVHKWDGWWIFAVCTKYDRTAFKRQKYSQSVKNGLYDSDPKKGHPCFIKGPKQPIGSPFWIYEDENPEPAADEDCAGPPPTDPQGENDPPSPG